MTPQTRRKLARFRSIKRGYYSLILIGLLILASLLAELQVNNRALIVSYQGRRYFPTYTAVKPGTTFGLDYAHETDYRQLARQFKAAGDGNWVLMPPVPYGPYENDFRPGEYPPFAPGAADRHFLGTDTVGRDVLARLVYGFRIAFFFSLGLLLINYTIGIGMGAMMGYLGGRFDLVGQRLIEIWSNVPVLYVIIIISSIVVPNFTLLILIMALFGWMGITWTVRTVTYKEREREYVLAARALGASTPRIILHHILPNTLAVIITFAPFAISGGIIMLTSLDYLGFGLPPPTPSWGELLQQGWANMDAWWIATAVIAAMVITLTAVTFVGEAVREAFDPRQHTVYR